MNLTVQQLQRLNEFSISDCQGNSGNAHGVFHLDPVTGLPYNAQQGYVWSTTALAWVKATQSGGSSNGGGGLVQIQDSAGNNLTSTSGALNIYMVNGVSGTVTTVPSGTTTVSGNVTAAVTMPRVRR